jgi:hypothetical protein
VVRDVCRVKKHGRFSMAFGTGMKQKPHNLEEAS